jgi:hypothetical protein
MGELRSGPGWPGRGFAAKGRRAYDPGYAWIITEDRLEDGKRVGVMGPGGVTLSGREIKNHPEREYFAMYDDDGNLYYRGYFVGGEWASGFEPLDDYGMPNAGAVEIRYRNPKTGKMETL